MDTFQKTIDASRIAAEALAFPPFVGPERESTPLNASPYVARLIDLREGRFLSGREAFVRQFVAAVRCRGGCFSHFRHPGGGGIAGRQRDRTEA